MESEGSAVPLVFFTIPWAADRVHSDFEYFARLSFVGCMGTVLASVVSGRTRLPWSLLRLFGASYGASRSMPLADQYRGGNHELRRFTDLSDKENLWVL